MLPRRSICLVSLFAELHFARMTFAQMSLRIEPQYKFLSSPCSDFSANEGAVAVSNREKRTDAERLVKGFEVLSSCLMAMAFHFSSLSDANNDLV